MARDIFKDGTKSVPRTDPQIVRVDFEQSEIAGRKDHLPKSEKSSVLPISHVQGK